MRSLSLLLLLCLLLPACGKKPSTLTPPPATAGQAAYPAAYPKPAP